MKQLYLEPEVQVLSLELEIGILAGGSNEGFDTPIPGTWGSLNIPPMSL